MIIYNIVRIYYIILMTFYKYLNAAQLKNFRQKINPFNLKGFIFM